MKNTADVDLPVMLKVLKNMLKEPTELKMLTKWGVPRATVGEQRRQYKRVKFLADKLVTAGLLGRMSNDPENPRSVALYTVEKPGELQALAEEPAKLSTLLYRTLTSSPRDGSATRALDEPSVDESIPEEHLQALSTPEPETPMVPMVSNEILFKALMGMAEDLQALHGQVQLLTARLDQALKTAEDTAQAAQLRFTSMAHQLEQLQAKEGNCAFRQATAQQGVKR